MRKILDIIRMIIISPELLIGAGVTIVFILYAKAAEFAFDMLRSDQQLHIAVVLGIPIALLIASYKIGSDLLSPTGKRQVILGWPEYWRLKYRVVYSLVLCVLTFIISLLGFYLVHRHNSVNGAIAMIVAWSVATIALFSLALAKWKAREILGE